MTTNATPPPTTHAGLGLMLLLIAMASIGPAGRKGVKMTSDRLRMLRWVTA